MAQAIIGRWGRTLALRLPAEVVRLAGLSDRQRVDFIVQDGDVVIRKVAPEITAENMFRGTSAEEWRTLYASAYDWGPDRGRERIAE